jgi:hypothetical protein
MLTYADVCFLSEELGIAHDELGKVNLKQQ